MNESVPQTSLCQLNKQTCGACCWGVGLDKATLELRLHQHRRSFAKATADGKLKPYRLFWHELRCRKGVDLLWAVALRIPAVGQWLKRRISQKMICAFIGFDTEAGERVGCMLHPSRYDGVDSRNANAFRLLPGIVCGDTHYTCDGCHRYDNMTADHQSAFTHAVSGLNWFEYTQTVRALSAGVVISAQTKEQPNSSGSSRSAPSAHAD